MCGLAGYIQLLNKNGDYPLDGLSVLRAMQHRGPDDRGYFIDPLSGATLVHTRLSVIDLSEAAHQPMSSKNHQHHIVFNGEIYNYKHLV